eukprot:gene882-5713_t
MQLARECVQEEVELEEEGERLDSEDDRGDGGNFACSESDSYASSTSEEIIVPLEMLEQFEDYYFDWQNGNESNPSSVRGLSGVEEGNEKGLSEVEEDNEKDKSSAGRTSTAQDPGSLHTAIQSGKLQEDAALG